MATLYDVATGIGMTDEDILTCDQLLLKYIGENPDFVKGIIAIREVVLQSKEASDYIFRMAFGLGMVFGATMVKDYFLSHVDEAVQAGLQQAVQKIKVEDQ
jgi:hypothetical protein